jgi:hypothetical protein
MGTGLKAAGLLFIAAGVAAAAHSVKAVRATRPPVIDGVIDELEWAGATRFENFLQFEPKNGQPSRFKTAGYFLYDGTHLYFAVHAVDDRPDQITARLTRRDAELSGDDSVYILLDTFHDRRTCYFFGTNALGTQHDGRVQDNGRIDESSWDAAWNVAARVRADGWSAEFAIPLRSMLFRSGTGRTWGINVGRTHRRTLETSLWAGPLEATMRVSQYGELTGLDLEGGAKRYEFIPSLLGRYEQGRSLKGDAGLDFRYTLRPETTANLTVNPDFATIEADQEFVNLTRFEPQLTEKRPFFLEGNEKVRQRIPIFYSRRIADIDFGGKLLSRNGPWDFALLSAQSRIQATDGAHRANYAVARAARQILNSSSVGLMAANRLMDGRASGAIGLDTAMYFTRGLNFTGQLVRSHGAFRESNWAYFLRPSYDSSTGHVHFRYSHLGNRFGDNVNAVGFVQDDDRREMDSDLSKILWFEKGLIQRVELSSRNNIYWSQRNVLRSYHNVETVIVELRNRWNGGIEHTNDFKRFEQGFHNDTLNLFFGYNTREYNSFDGGYIAGRNFGSDLRSANFAFRRKLTPALSAEYRFNRVWLKPDPQQRGTVIHIVRSQYYFTRDLFLRLFFQTNSVIDRRNVEVVFVWRYNPPFGALQFAYQRGRAEFGQRSQQGNTLLLKLSHVF